jgi:hypothetical protein
MSQLLYDRNSASVHLSTVKRHMRLCRQIPGAETLATAIEPCYNELVAKVAATALAVEDCDNKRDQVLLKDAILDDKVRDLMGACNKSDRDIPGQTITAQLFPDGLSGVIYAPFETEPTDVEKLILGIRNLGRSHALSAHIEPLQTAIDACRAALTGLHEAITAEKTAEALENIAKVNLARQYEQNLYSAETKFGKRYANRFFPVIHAPAKEVVEEVKN